MIPTPKTYELLLDPVIISKDFYADCAQAIIETILFLRNIHSEACPRKIFLPGADFSYLNSNTEEGSEKLKKLLTQMQTAIMYTNENDTWIALILSYSTPIDGFLRTTEKVDIFEKWFIKFQFQKTNTNLIREAMQHLIIQVKQKAEAVPIQSKPTPRSFVKYTIDIPIDLNKGAIRDLSSLLMGVFKTSANAYDI